MAEIAAAKEALATRAIAKEAPAREGEHDDVGARAKRKDVEREPAGDKRDREARRRHRQERREREGKEAQQDRNSDKDTRGAREPMQHGAKKEGGKEKQELTPRGSPRATTLLEKMGSAAALVTGAGGGVGKEAESLLQMWQSVWYVPAAEEDQTPVHTPLQTPRDELHGVSSIIIYVPSPEAPSPDSHP